MSVLIKGMKLPKDCFECVMSDAGGNCLLQDRDFLPWNEQIKGCPLIEIPEPHGDLIDRDALVKDLTNGIKAGLLLDGYEKYQNINNMDDCVECAKYADAVIEAEGSED